MLGQLFNIHSQPFLEELVRIVISNGKINNVTPVAFSSNVDEEAGVLYYGFVSGFPSAAPPTELITIDDGSDFVPYDVFHDGAEEVLRANCSSKLAFFKATSGLVNFIGFKITVDGSISGPDNPEPPPPSGDDLATLQELQVFFLNTTSPLYNESFADSAMAGYHKKNPYVTYLLAKGTLSDVAFGIDGEIGTFYSTGHMDALDAGFEIGASNSEYDAIVGMKQTFGALPHKLPFEIVGNTFANFVFEGRLTGIRLRRYDNTGEPMNDFYELKTPSVGTPFDFSGAHYVHVIFDFYNGGLITTEDYPFNLYVNGL